MTVGQVQVTRCGRQFSGPGHWDISDGTVFKYIVYLHSKIALGRYCIFLPASSPEK